MSDNTLGVLVVVGFITLVALLIWAMRRSDSPRRGYNPDNSFDPTPWVIGDLIGDLFEAFFDD